MTTLAPTSAPPVARRPLVGHPLVLYFALAYALSWAVEIPLVAAARGWTTRTVPFSLHYLAAFGPFVAAVVVSWWADGRAGLQRLASRLVHWRVPLVSWLYALAPLFLYGATATVLRFLRGSWPDTGALGRVNFLPDLGLGALALWIMTYGIGEETGWRGFALPRLQRGRSALTASLLLGLLWAGWHLPTLFYLPSYVRHGLAAVPGLVIGVVLGSIVLTSLVNWSRGSLLMPILWHATFNFVTAPPAADQTITAVETTAVLVWAAIVVVKWRPATLSPAGKYVA